LRSSLLCNAQRDVLAIAKVVLSFLYALAYFPSLDVSGASNLYVSYECNIRHVISSAYRCELARTAHSIVSLTKSLKVIRNDTI